VPGRFEWCRIRSPTHGAFDTFILLGATTAAPATVYVNSRAGADFMEARYAECATHRVRPRALRITEARRGRTVHGLLEAGAGPLRRAAMVLTAPIAAIPVAVSYGGHGEPVWGSRRFTCWGVDLVLAARASGRVQWADGRVERLRGAPAVVTMGSFGRIAPRAPTSVALR
jgi:hypothetical protein